MSTCIKFDVQISKVECVKNSCNNYHKHIQQHKHMQSSLLIINYHWVLATILPLLKSTRSRSQYSGNSVPGPVWVPPLLWCKCRGQTGVGSLSSRHDPRMLQEDHLHNFNNFKNWHLSNWNILITNYKLDIYNNSSKNSCDCIISFYHLYTRTYNYFYLLHQTPCSFDGRLFWKLFQLRARICILLYRGYLPAHH